MNGQRPVLLVEDDTVDAMTVTRAFQEIRITNPLAIANNGEEAMTYLNDQSKQCPCIILLDLNMPRMNGLEFLEIVKKDPHLKKIPVIVLTTSSSEQDKLESFNLGVAGYMLKPVSYLKFVEVVRTIDLYWTLSEVPEA